MLCVLGEQLNSRWSFEFEPPLTDDEALDTHARWGLAACGVEIGECDNPSEKGRGAFTVRPFKCGEFVG